MSKTSRKNPLVLFSHRGTKIYSIKLCVLCKIHKEGTFYYPKSNWGSVHVCALCKGELFNRSFGNSGETSDIFVRQKRNKHDSRRSLSPQEATQKLQAIRSINIINNKEIEEYIENNPVIEKLGKFGVPQDKYRYNFYGSSSMEPDIWRKGDKNT